MSLATNTRNGVFISYSHADKKHLDRLLMHLAPLQRGGKLSVWADTRLKAGDQWREEIEQAIDSASVAIVLVSAAFLASPFIADNELPPLLSAARDDGVLIIPVVVGACNFHSSLLANIQAVNEPSKPLDMLSRAKRDVVWVNLVQRIEQMLGTEESTGSAKRDSPLKSQDQFALSTRNAHSAEPANTPPWKGMGGEQMLHFASELKTQERFTDLLRMTTDLNLQGHYYLAAEVARNATIDPAAPYSAWFELAFALAKLNVQTEAISAFEQAYELVDARLRDQMQVITVPSGTQAVAFAGAGSGVQHHGMGKVPDAYIVIPAAGNKVLIGGNLTQRGTIRPSTFHKTAIHMTDMGGNLRWVAVAIALGEGPDTCQTLTPVPEIDRAETDELVRWGALLNDNKRHFEALSLLSKAIRQDNQDFNAWFEYAYALAQDTTRRVEAIASFNHAALLCSESNAKDGDIGPRRIKHSDVDEVSVFTGVGPGLFYHRFETRPTNVQILTRDRHKFIVDEQSLAATTIFVSAVSDGPWIAIARKSSPTVYGGGNADTRHDQHWPMLVPVGVPHFQASHQYWLDWQVSEQNISLRNMGTGVAFNVASVLYGCESYVVGDIGTEKRVDNAKANHWTCWLGSPIAPGETVSAPHAIGGSVFFEGRNHIGSHGFNAPPQPYYADVLMGKASYRTARTIITFSDMFGHKHASIFDYVQQTGGWQLVAFMPEIVEDLHDLEGSAKES